MLGLGVLTLLGCATSSPFNQSFLEAQTAHFEIISSLGDDETIELARELERIHSAALFLLGEPQGGSGAEKTRVLAFDGRSFGRPFALRGEPAYYLPQADAGTIVIRAGGDWARRVDADLLHRYAHRLARSGTQGSRPLWMEEGQARLIGATRSVGGRLQVGAPNEEFLALIRDWKRGNLASVLLAADLSQETHAQRELFEARAWSLVQWIRFGPRNDPGVVALRRYVAEIEERGAMSSDRGHATLPADLDGIANRIHDYISQDQFRVEVLRTRGEVGFVVGPRPISQARARSALGRLALAIGDARLAREYFERALQSEADLPEALAGLAEAHAQLESFAEVEGRLERAALLAGDDARVQAWIGDAWLAAAQSTEEAGERRRRLERARTHFRRSLALDATGIDARVGLGMSHGLMGEDPVQGLEWLESAARLRPGSLVIELERARLELALGRRAAARARAREIISRTHHEPLIRSAREVLGEAEAARRP